MRKSTLKKLSFTLMVCLLALMALSLPVSAAVVFEDNFSSGDFTKWTNAVLDGNPDTNDTDCDDEAKIVNGALEIKNYDTAGSFFYIAPKDIRLKNFTISFKLKVMKTNNGWVGISVRKDTNDRYNGCNNVLNYLRLDGENNTIAYQALRGYPGAGGGPDLTTKIVDPTPFSGNVKEWHKIKLVVNEDKYTAYVDDQPIGTLVYAKNMVEGFMSINACYVDVAIDDVKVEDTAAQSESSNAGTGSSGSTDNSGKQSPAAEATPAANAEATPEATPAPTEAASTEESTQAEATAADASTSTEQTQTVENSQAGTAAAESTGAAQETAGNAAQDAGNGNVVLIIVIIAVIVLGGAAAFLIMKKKASNVK